MARREQPKIDGPVEAVDVSTDSGSFDALFHETTNELMAAYAKETLVYTGAYLTKVRAQYEKCNPEDAEFDAGRRVINLAVSYYLVDAPLDRVGDGFIKTSPVARYTPTGKLDNACKRYAELAKALGLSGRDADEVYEKANRVMFMTKVREVYVVPEEELLPEHQDKRIGPDGNAWVALQREDTDAREHYLDIGLEPRVMVDRVYKVKEPVNRPVSARTVVVADDAVPF